MDPSEDDTDTLEERMDEVESQVDEMQAASQDNRTVDVEELQTRIEAIETHQAELREGIESLATRIQDNEQKTPRIGTVEQLYADLAGVEESMEAIREQIAELTSEDNIN